jgi:predicted transcriptional regulator of viral defense system
MRRSLVIDPGLDKLQEMLLGMAPGDEISVAQATAVSGLNESQCDTVLEALMRAGLMMRLQHGAYVRRQLDMPPSSEPGPRRIRS